MRAKVARAPDWEPANLLHPHIHDELVCLVSTSEQMIFLNRGKKKRKSGIAREYQTLCVRRAARRACPSVEIGTLMVM